MPMTNQAARLQIILEASLVTKGMGALDGIESRFAASGDRIAARAAATADAEARSALKAQAAYEKSYSRIEAAHSASVSKIEASQARLADAELKLSKASADGKIEQMLRYQAVADNATRAMLAAQKAADTESALSARRLADARIAMNDQVARSNRAAAASQSASADASVAGLYAGAGSAALGAGTAGLALFAYAADKAMRWGQFTNQIQANTILAPRQVSTIGNRAWGVATQTGANPQDVMNAYRYGADMGLLGPNGNMGLLTNTVNAATQTALPTGAQISDVEAAINIVQKNFPQWRNQPMAIANMLLQSARYGRMNLGQLVQSAPQTLMVAGHYGGQMLPQSLAALSALTSANGGNVDEANTMLYNLITRIAAPTAAVKKELAGLQSQGVDLTGDFTYRGLSSKGLVGVIQDIRNANLSPDVLKKLFPYMRSYLGALSLTGNQEGSFLSILGKVNQAPAQNPVGKNYQSFLGLPSTQWGADLKQIEKDLVDVGTIGIPLFSHFLRDMQPLLREFDTFLKDNQGLIVLLERLAPEMIGFGLGMKAGNVAVGLMMSTLTKFGVTAETVATKDMVALDASLVTLGATSDKVAAEQLGASAAEGAGGLTGAVGGLGIAAGTAETAIGVEGADIGLTAALGGLAGAATVAIPIIGGLILALALAPKKLTPPGAGISGNYGFWDPRGWIQDFAGPKGIPNPVQDPSGFSSWLTGQNGTTYNRNSPFSSSNPPTSSNGHFTTAMSARASSDPFKLRNNTLGGYWGSISSVAPPLASTVGGVDFGRDASDIDFNNPNPGHPGPVDLPGTSKGTWTFEKMVPDAKGGYGQIWKDPMGTPVLFWHLDQKSGQGWHSRQTEPGGTLIGYTGNGSADQGAHACIVTSPQGVKDIAYLTSAQAKNLQNKGYTVQTLTAGGGISSGTAGAINTASSKTGVDPTILYGVNKQEGGTNFGLSATFPNQTAAADQSATYLKNLYTWTGTATIQAEMKKHGLDPSNPQNRWMVALSAYNVGQNSPYLFDSVYSDGSSNLTASDVSGKYSTRTPYARGMLYAKKVMAFSKNAPLAGSPNPTTGQQNYQNLGNTPAQQLQSDQAGFNAVFGSLSFSQLSGPQRDLYKSFIYGIAQDTYAIEVATINQMTWMSKQQRDAALAAAKTQLGQSERGGMANAFYGALTTSESYDAQTIQTKWQGIDPTTLSGPQLQAYLHDMYRLNELNRQASDNQAKADYASGKITKKQLQARLGADNTAKNRANQQLRGQLNLGGPAGRTEAVHVTSHSAPTTHHPSSVLGRDLTGTHPHPKGGAHPSSVLGRDLTGTHPHPHRAVADAATLVARRTKDNTDALHQLSNEVINLRRELSALRTGAGGPGHGAARKSHNAPYAREDVGLFA